MPAPSAAKPAAVAAKAGLYSSKGPLLMTGIVASKAPSLLVGLVAVLILASEVKPQKHDIPKIRHAAAQKAETQPAPPVPEVPASAVARLQLPPPPAPTLPAAAPPQQSETPPQQSETPPPVETPAPKVASEPVELPPGTRMVVPMRAETPPPKASPKPRPAADPPSPPRAAPEPLIVTPMKPAPSEKKPALQRPPGRPKPPAARPPAPETPTISALAPADAPVPETPEAVDGSENRATGRALLRMLEHGKGPKIEIAWPNSAAERQRLYRRFTRCYGMQAAVLDSANKLFAANSAPGESWDIDRDRYSGFLRSPAGESIGPERRRFSEIAARHRLTSWRPVRVFPRNVDAVLLGGLETILGARYQSSGNIRATYDLDGAKIYLTAITVDARGVAGRVDLSGVASRGCRTTARS